MNAKCSECGRPHADPEKLDSDWCWDCIDQEMIRSLNEDATGQVSTFLGQPTSATCRSRPPKFMLRPEEYKKYGY